MSGTTAEYYVFWAPMSLLKLVSACWRRHQYLLHPENRYKYMVVKTIYQTLRDFVNGGK